jgi:hypothetical protein
MVPFIQKAHGCFFFCYAIEAQAAQLAISDRPLLMMLPPAAAAIPAYAAAACRCK